jgi:hypothetical protein
MVITTTALTLPGVAPPVPIQPPPAWPWWRFCLPQYFALCWTCSFSVPVPASRMATATFVAEPLFM